MGLLKSLKLRGLGILINNIKCGCHLKLFPLLFLFLSGCKEQIDEFKKLEFPSPARGDYSMQINENYTISRTSPFFTMIAPSGFTKETPVIPPNILECNFDSKF